jgi:hypothetical protein
MLNKELIEFAVLILLVLIHLLDLGIYSLTLFYFGVKLFLKLSLYVCLPQRVELEVPIDLRCKLVFGQTHFPKALHEVIELGVSTFKSLFLFSFLLCLMLLKPSLFSLELLSFLRVKQTKKLVDLLLVL